MGELMRLQMLLELQRRGTVTAVAETLTYSTSAVSQQLAQLERDFGAALLRPDGRRVRLTAQGELLAAHAEAIVRSWESARAAVTASLDEVSGTLAVASFQTAYSSLVPQAVRSITGRHPNARITVIQEDAERALSLLLAREVDVAITEKFPGQSLALADGVVGFPLFRDRMLVAVPEDWFADEDPAAPPPPLADLADRDWVFESPGSPVRSWAFALCRSAGFEPRIAFETSDVAVQLCLVRAGIAAALVPQLTPAWLFGRARIRELGEDQSRTVYAVTRAGLADLPLVRVLVDELRSAREAGDR